MQPKHVLHLVLLIPLILTACTTSKAGPNANIASYAMKIKCAVEKKMYRAELYKGQVCTIRMSLARDGSVSNVTADNGDPKLCHAALMAVKQANIPPAPDEKTWQLFKNPPLDFRP
ncbi:TPA: cell envelope integrity protein TolA [Enterobacter hormaechei]